MIRGLIFDFDGVVADSEVLANAVLAEFVSELGVPTTVEDSYRHFMGKRFHEVIAAIESVVGRPIPDTFGAQWQQRTLNRFERDLTPIAGVIEFIHEFDALPRCIASSSTPQWLEASLRVLKMTELFGRHVYSAVNVARGKPHPDIFLHAAAEIEIPTGDCLVIEDSPSGVIAGRKAGCIVVGLLAAGHIREGHADRLMDSGAHYLAQDYQDIRNIVHSLNS